MTQFRISRAAEGDIVAILAWTESQFGAPARLRYEALIVAALREAADCRDGARSTPRPELGTGVYSWHLRQSVGKARGGRVRRPRHVILYRLDGELMVVGRVLHEAMDTRSHLEGDESWT